MLMHQRSQKKMHQKVFWFTRSTMFPSKLRRVLTQLLRIPTVYIYDA
jgi:hypothetical protein